MARNATPDILGKIMGLSKQESNKTIKPASNQTIENDNHKEIKQVNKKTSKPKNNKAIKPVSNQPIKPDNHKEIKQVFNRNKEKATFNMPTELLEQLDDAWFRLKKILKNKDQRITKTLIVEVSLKKCLDDFDHHLKDSEIFKEIVKDSS